MGGRYRCKCTTIKWPVTRKSSARLSQLYSLKQPGWDKSVSSVTSDRVANRDTWLCAPMPPVGGPGVYVVLGLNSYINLRNLLCRVIFYEL